MNQLFFSFWNLNEKYIWCKLLPCIIHSSTLTHSSIYVFIWASLVAQLVKDPPAMQETWVWSLVWEDPLEEGTATPSSILVWRIHGQRSLAGCSPWSRRELDTAERLSLSLIYLFIFGFTAALGLYLVVVSGGYSLLWCCTSSRCLGSEVMAHGLSCSMARGIFPDQGSNPCSLHWQVGS